MPGPDDAEVKKPALVSEWGGWKVLASKSGHSHYLFLICCAGLGKSLALSERLFICEIQVEKL